jgi:hypothetical protein
MRAVHNCARIVTLGYYKGRDTFLELGAEWHHNRLELISSMPVWQNPSREYPLWDKARLTGSLVEMFVKQQLRSTGIIDPLVDLAEAPAAFLNIITILPRPLSWASLFLLPKPPISPKWPVQGVS